MPVLKRAATGEVVLSQVEIASSFGTRLLGLMGRAALPEEGGLLISRCSSIHMWFMRFSIDALFLKGLGQNQYQVEAVHSNLRPWKLFPVGALRATDVLEVAAGQAQLKRVKVGELLCLN